MHVSDSLEEENENDSRHRLDNLQVETTHADQELLKCVINLMSLIN